jgi:hypothetical protein
MISKGDYSPLYMQQIVTYTRLYIQHHQWDAWNPTEGRLWAMNDYPLYHLCIYTYGKTNKCPKIHRNRVTHPREVFKPRGLEFSVLLNQKIWNSINVHWKHEVLKHSYWRTRLGICLLGSNVATPLIGMQREKTVQCSLIHICSFVRQINVSRINISMNVDS